MKRNVGSCFLLIVMMLASTGCQEKESGNSSLDTQAFEKAINDTSEKIILDVRTPEEFNDGHIRNAMLINFHDADFQEQVEKLDKNTPIYVYCASGVRSDKAAAIMKEKGFDQVYVLKSGLNDWLDQEKEIVK